MNTFWEQTLSKRWIQLIIGVFIVGLLLIYTQSNKPYVRKGNMDQDNPYGDEGEQRLPQAIIIGIRKAGTRALLKYLRSHPDVRTAPAECHFFSSKVNYHAGLEFYRKQMPYSKANQITIEKTPNYFHRRNSAPRIHEMNSSIKLILVLREPSKRALSDYWQFEYRKGERRTFEELAFTRSGEVKKSYQPVFRSIYYKILKKYWLPYFPKEQILIVDGDALGHSNPGKEMIRVQEFLGISKHITEDSFEYNAEKGFYCIKSTKKFQGCLGSNKGRTYPPQDEAAMYELKQFYSKYNKKLFDFIGIDFGWNFS